ncbi:collagen-like protein [Candidatus Neomarinimicrobiota bacterium]
MKILTLATIILIAVAACEGPVGPEGPLGPEGPIGPEGPAGTGQDQDKLLRIPFSGVGIFNADTTTSISSAEIYRFSKLDYVDVDSITFVTKLWLNYSYADVTEGAVATARIYNLTDSTFVEHSVVQSSSIEEVWVESGDIYPYLPEEEINLAISLRTSISMVHAHNRYSHLYVYRR